MPYDEEKVPVVALDSVPDDKRSAAQFIKSDLAALLSYAQRHGIAVTVELEPLEPLAMGHYRMVGNVRGAR